ncbi:CsgE family curli-type amyloid fiber assembly protein [Microbulbifer epialgicus]|uniref:Curli production assembly/transport component CsgE n=1 Tax=Microbulbifer epialgicus TaxID=393907 RepID=A0ABV4NZ19_9GAMM
MRPALLIFMFLTVHVIAQDDTIVPPADTDSGRLEDEISGFNIDRTITRTGHDFARFMSEYRNLNYPDATYNLTIYERPSARWGNLIWVTYNDKIVFRRFISPSTNNIHRLADEAAQYIHEAVLQERVRSALTDNFDLGKDEF